MKLTIASLLMAVTMTSQAAMPTEVVKDIEPTVQMILTDKPCTLWTVPEGAHVYAASVTDTSINKTAVGCWEMEPNDIVHVDIVIPDEKSFFSYRYPAKDFTPRPNL